MTTSAYVMLFTLAAAAPFAYAAVREAVRPSKQGDVPPDERIAIALGVGFLAGSVAVLVAERA